MSTLCWNIRGLGKPVKRSLIKDIVLQSKCNVVCFQETKINHITPDIISSTYGKAFDSWEVVNATGAVGGILTCWKSDLIQVSHLYKGLFSLSTQHQWKMQTSTASWVTTNVYGPTDNHLKKEFLDELNAIRSIWKGPWIIIGDFNIIRFSDERKGASNCHASSNHFNQFINSHSLMEIKLEHRRFTWSNHRENPTLAKLDRCLISLE